MDTVLAERKGFEPSVPRKEDNGFRVLILSSLPISVYPEACVNGHRSFRRSGRIRFPDLAERLRLVISHRIDRWTPLPVVARAVLERAADGGASWI